MTYLYGDSTPFPLDENFIDTVRDATELCNVLLVVDRALEQLRQESRNEREAVEGTLADFKKLAGDMVTTLQPYATESTAPVKDLSARLVQAVRGVMEQAQGSLVARRDGNINQAHQRMREERSRALPALQKFLLQHELGGTVWSLFYSIDETQRVVARATAQTPFNLQATFELQLPPTSPWITPVKVSDLRQNVTVSLPKKGRRKTTKRKVDLDRYFVTEVRLAEESGLVLRRSLKPSAGAFRFTWDKKGITVVPMDDGATPSPPIAVEEFDAVGLGGLRDEVDVQLRPLTRHRVQLASAAFLDKPVADLDTPAPIARLIIRAIAPYVREIHRRSPVEGELTLKREVEDGRREEVFIAMAELIQIFDSLPPDRRAFFDEFGLEEEGGATEEPPPVEEASNPRVVVDMAMDPEESGVMELSTEDSGVVELPPEPTTAVRNSLALVGEEAVEPDTEVVEVEGNDEPPTLEAMLKDPDVGKD